MHDDDDRPKPSGPMAALAVEDIELLSVEELADRIARLEAEIARTRRMQDRKGVSRSVAESLFRKP